VVADASSAARTEEDESDWEFNGDLPANPGDSSPQLHTVRAPDPSAPSDRELFAGPEEDVALASDPAPRARAVSPAPTSPSGSEALGSPVDWDFLDRADSRTAAAPALPSRETAIPREPRAGGFDGAAGRAPHEIPVLLRRAVAGAGWLATASLCALAL